MLFHSNTIPLMTSSPEEILNARGIRPTPVRILVLRALQQKDCAVSLMSLEAEMQTVDRSSIFRTLNLLLKNNLVHTIEDGSGSLKYELCNSHSHDSYDDQHVHFYCEACGQTYCLHHINIPRVELPEDFVVNSANFIIKGICPKCKHKK